MTTTRNKAFQVRGMTDQITTCELCGRDELRGTVQMIELDADGNPMRDLYFGTGCAATAAGWTQREVTERVKAAEQARRDAEAAERHAIRQHTEAEYAAYLTATYGTSDTRAIMTRLGLRTARKLLEGFDAHRAALRKTAAMPAVAPRQLALTGLPTGPQQLSIF